MYLSRGNPLQRIKDSFLRLPQVVKVLLGLQTALYILMLVLSDQALGQWITMNLALNPANVWSGWLWTPFTYLWFHFRGDLFGFLFDILILWSLGGLFGQRWRPNHFVFFFIASGVIAGFVDSLLYMIPGGWFAAPVMGTSGSVFALFVAFYFVYGDQGVSVMGSSPMKGRTVFYLLAGLETVLFIAGANPHYGIQLGGALAGWFLVTGRWRPGKMKRFLDDRTARWRRKQQMRQRDMRVVH
jgi:membrane associated rhomboid family serine protease